MGSLAFVTLFDMHLWPGCGTEKVGSRGRGRHRVHAETLLSVLAGPLLGGLRLVLGPCSVLVCAK